jgi:hypothetical protein
MKKDWREEFDLRFHNNWEEDVSFWKQDIKDFISALLSEQRAEVLKEVEKAIKNHLKKEVICTKKCLIENVINKLK